MAPRSRKSGSKSKKVKMTKPRPGATQARPTVAELLQVQTKTTTTTTSIVASTTSDNVDIKVTQTVQEETSISQPVTPGKKRKVDDTDATDLAEDVSPRKKRTLSNESNPAGRTRSQTKLLKKILGQGENDDVDYSILDDTQAVVKSEVQSNDDVPADGTIALAAKVEEETVELTIKNEDEEAKVETKLERKSKAVALALIAKQSTLDAILVERKPHPASKGVPFKVIKLKYMKGRTFRMPVELVNAFDLDDRNIKNGVLKVKPEAPFWDNGALGIKFGFSPFLDRIEPTPAQCLSVWNALDAWLRSRETPVIIQLVGTIASQAPAHGNTGITVDCLVRTIMAQATANGLALTVQSLVNKRFTYTVNGKQVEGKLPNYHAMRVATQAELEEAIKQGGLFKSKASTIMNALNAVYDKNVEIIKAANGGILPPNTQLGQAPGHPDFVPGLLSMNFMTNMTMAEVFNFIVNIDGIGHKTAACILEFNYGFPICAVDIHVNKMARWLGWVPENSSELQTFRHLEGRIPNHLKHLLHQAFWHHPQLCKRCKLGLARDDPGLDKDGGPLGPCPIEHLLTRVKPKPVPRKRAVLTAPEEGEQKVPKAVMPWKAFADADEAANEGYQAFTIALDDDFAAGSVNVAVVQKWRYVGFEA